MKVVSVIIPCYNESQNIKELYRRIVDLFSNGSYSYEILFIDNASIDNSMAIYKELILLDSSVSVISMARNFGTSQSSYLAGIHYASGDAVVLMDGDLQDPPEVIMDFINEWQKGFDVVYGVRKKRKGSIARRICYKMFYRVFRWLSYLEIPLDAGDFGLLDRKVVNIIKKLPEKDVFIRGLRAWVGFNQKGVAYVREDRFSGRSSISFFSNFSWAKKAITNFSYKPLEFISRLAIVSILLTFCAGIIYLYIYFKAGTPRGFLTLLLFIFIFATIQLTALSVIAEYLIRIFQEVKGRPPFIVKEILNNKNKLNN